jgi:hypothetical protein
MTVMSKTVIEHVPAELVSNGKARTVRLKLTVKELMANESLAPVARAVAHAELVPASAVAIEDGPYTLRYTFNGKKEEYPVRMQGGFLLAG